MSDSRSPRIKDLARHLGVSSATVSRALSDSDLVAKATRDKIRDAARSMNFRPNVSARNLRTNRSMTVLIVVSDIANPFYLEVVKGVQRKAREAGYSVLMGNTDNDPNVEAEYFAMLRDGHADGLLLMTGRRPAEVQPDALHNNAVVVALESIADESVPHVIVDNRAAAIGAVEHLLELGHQRIAHISGPLGRQVSLDRRDGFREAMQAAGLPIPAGYEQPGNFMLDSGTAACQRLFELTEPPTALFVANDEMAFGAISYLRQRGLDVPADVSVVGFDDILMSEAFFPPLTTVYQPRVEIGMQAMSVLLNRMIGPRKQRQAGQTPTIIPTQLMVRGSTAAPQTGSIKLSEENG
ncbi:MAG: LacI family DNA-binding transcriptional regulator [Burkholderiaceae bacterium]